MFRSVVLTALGAGLWIAAAAGAPVADRKSLTLEGAETGIAAARAEAVRQNCAGVIATA